MDITKINCIPVICSKCDTVMQSYEPGLGPRARTLFQSRHTYLKCLRNLPVCVEITPENTRSMTKNDTILTYLPALLTANTFLKMASSQHWKNLENGIYCKFTFERQKNTKL